MSSGAFYRVFQSLLQDLPEPFTGSYEGCGITKIISLTSLLVQGESGIRVPSLPVFRSFLQGLLEPSAGSSRAFYRVFQSLLMANKYPEPAGCQSSRAFYMVFQSLKRVFWSLLQGLPEPSKWLTNTQGQQPTKPLSTRSKWH